MPPVHLRGEEALARAQEGIGAGIGGGIASFLQTRKDEQDRKKAFQELRNLVTQQQRFKAPGGPESIEEMKARHGRQLGAFDQVPRDQPTETYNELSKYLMMKGMAGPTVPKSLEEITAGRVGRGGITLEEGYELERGPGKAVSPYTKASEPDYTPESWDAYLASGPDHDRSLLELKPEKDKGERKVGYVQAVMAKFIDKGFVQLNEQEQAIVKDQLRDPLFAQATKLVMDDIDLFGEPVEVRARAIFDLYSEMLGQQGALPYQRTGQPEVGQPQIEGQAIPGSVQEMLLQPQTKPQSLQSGAKGPQVTELQTKLKEHGFFNDPKDIIDGDYGPRTAAAVEKFQKDRGLAVEVFGVAGPLTKQALEQMAPAVEPQVGPGIEEEELFDELPDPAYYKDKTIYDSETGQRYRSDGTRWIPVE